MRMSKRTITAALVAVLLCAAVIALTVSLVGARGEVDQAKEENGRLNAALTQLADDFDLNERDLQEQSSRLQSLRDDRDSKAEALDESSLVSEELEDRTESLTADLQALENLRDELSATVATLERQHDSLEASYAGLSEEYARLGEENAGLGEENTGLGEENAGLIEENTGLGEENAGLKATVEGLESTRHRLEAENETLKLAHTNVEGLEEAASGLRAVIAGLEERISGLRAVIAGLEEDRRALVVESREMFPTCTGSMEPKITCQDTVVELSNFRPEDIAVGTVISFYPPTGADGTASPLLHRVTDVKVEDGVYYFWTKGDAREEPDGYWVPEGNVRGYVIELRQGTRPLNSELRARVNGAKERHDLARARMLEARDAYDRKVVLHCGSLEAVAQCDTSENNFAEVQRAYEAFDQAWDDYLRAICRYDEAYYSGLYESEPREQLQADPYTSPSACSAVS